MRRSSVAPLSTWHSPEAVNSPYSERGKKQRILRIEAQSLDS